LAAGWTPGRLESEIQEKGWLHCPADPELIFGCCRWPRESAAGSSQDRQDRPSLCRPFVAFFHGL